MPRDGRKGRRWRYSAGSYGATVRVFERLRGGIIYAAVGDGRGREIVRSLGHRDRTAAQDFADEEARKLRHGLDELSAGPPTLRRIFRVYERERTPDKHRRVQSEDRRQIEMFSRLWGADFDLSKLDRARWDRFIRIRRSGAIDGRGNPIPKSAPCGCTSSKRPDCSRCRGSGQVNARRHVANRTIERDLKFLRAVSHWAMDSRGSDGRLYLDRDPTRCHEVPFEKNPRRPVASHDRVDAIRAVFRDVQMEVEWGPKRQEVESYLPEVFEIVVGTGRRIGAVCALRFEDLELDPTPSTPHGAIVWPEDTDKQGKRWRCPISTSVREALEAAIRKRPRIGPGPLFPTPRDPSRPIRYELASSWLRDAEKRACLEPHEGSLWHAYRRLWASARKDLPDVDVAQAGGWSSLDALKLAYQHPDDATMLKVVEHSTEIREIQ